MDSPKLPTRDTVKNTTDGNGSATVRSLFTAAQVAELWEVPESKVTAETRAGRLACVHIGRRVRYTADQIVAYVQQQSTTATNPYARSTRSRRRSA